MEKEIFELWEVVCFRSTEDEDELTVIDVFRRSCGDGPFFVARVDLISEEEEAMFAGQVIEHPQWLLLKRCRDGAIVCVNEEPCMLSGAFFTKVKKLPPNFRTQ